MFLFSKTFRVVYNILDPCMHANTPSRMYSSPVRFFFVVLRHVSSGYIFAITIVVAVDVVVRACRITSEFALQIPLLPLLMGLPVLIFCCSTGLVLISTSITWHLSKQKQTYCGCIKQTKL